MLSSLGSLVAGLAGHNLGDGMSDSHTSLLNVLLGQRRRDADSQSGLGIPRTVLGLDGMREWLSLGPRDHDTVGEGLHLG